MTNHTKLRLRNYAMVIVATVALLSGASLAVWFAVTRFHGLIVLGVLILEVALAGVAVQVYRWVRYPALVRGRSIDSLLLNLACAGGFVLFVLPVYVLLGLIPLAGHFVARAIPFDRWTYRLGLRFRHELFEPVQISLTAPEKFGPGARGQVAAIRLTDSAVESRFWDSPSATIIYRVLYEDDHEEEVPESYVV